jgi:hypothetical protein
LKDDMMPSLKPAALIIGLAVSAAMGGAQPPVQANAQEFRIAEVTSPAGLDRPRQLRVAAVR